MNEVIKQMLDRKSIRAYQDKAISQEDKDLIFDAAFNAPTAGDQQLYTILDITDQEIKDKLAVSCDNQPFIAKGKMVLVFVADPLKWYRAYQYSGLDPRDLDVGDFMISACDCLIAAQNAVCAAESLGIGSCYIGDIMENYEYHKELFKLPDHVFPICMAVFGYPEESQKNRIKPPRAAKKYLVYENTYHQADEDELKELLSTYSKERDYEEWLEAFCKRKYNSDFSREMSRSLWSFFNDFKK